MKIYIDKISKHIVATQVVDGPSLLAELNAKTETVEEREVDAIGYQQALAFDPVEMERLAAERAKIQETDEMMGLLTGMDELLKKSSADNETLALLGELIRIIKWTAKR